MESLTYLFKSITYYDVLQIEAWQYNGFEKCLYMDAYHESYKRSENPLLGPRGCRGFSAFNNLGELFGIMEYYFDSDGVHLGLGINPQFVGRGYSKVFILDGINFLRREFNYEDRILLEVDRRNIQGIKAYENVGFKLYRRVDNELHYRL